MCIKLYLRSEEHTSELQSPMCLVCRLLLEKKNLHLLPIMRGAGQRLAVVGAQINEMRPDRVASNRFQLVFFFFNDTATTEIYTLSLHDALPIYCAIHWRWVVRQTGADRRLRDTYRSEEHTSELQSPMYLVCRLLLEKKNAH